MASPPRRRIVSALVGALALVAVAVLAYLASAGGLATLRACRTCGTAGQPVPSHWVEVPAGDSWSVELEPGAGLVARGPARFEVAGRGRVAITFGTFFLAARSGQARSIALLKQGTAAGSAEGAVVSTGPQGGRVALVVSAEGNRAEVLAGSAIVRAQTQRQELPLKQNERWSSGHPVAPAAPEADEARWLDALAAP